ncbi:MAG: hypothetical protein JKY52_17085, partial [Flavobacteriales bacterium]|nr:hypothetical protein [Flavobacteriales bacterium]
MKTLNRLPVKLGLTIFLSLTLLLNLQAQVTNGSFETIDNLADVSGWTAICTTVIGSIQDAAPGGGMWCAQTNSGNTQGCFPGYTYQVISAINDGERWKLEGWAR